MVLRASRGMHPTSPSADFAFLFLGLPHTKLEPIFKVARSIARSTKLPIRYHIIADQAADRLQRLLRKQSRAPWFVSSTLAAPASVRQLHRRLCNRGSVGTNSRLYLWKPLAHLLLPTWVPRVILLDSDIFFFDDVAQLWHLFEGMRSHGQWIGLAAEQSPWNSEVEKLGGVSVNGGVQLLRLRAMRQHGFTNLIERYASKDPALPLNGETGLGVVGDQTLYSWMSVNDSAAQQRVALLPCAWNYQVGAWPVTVKEHDRWAQLCNSGCSAIHGNGVYGKIVLDRLLSSPSAAHTRTSCLQAFASQRGLRHYPAGSVSEQLLNRTAHDCCGGRRRWSGAPRE